MDPLDLQNQSSVYYVHVNENPNASLVVVPLNGRNYHNWARSMKRSLSFKNKFEFVDGSITMPDAFDPLYKAWTRCNNLVHSWILISVSPSIAENVSFLDTTYTVWSDLHERFAQADLIRIAELQQEVFSHKQGTSSVIDYFTKLKSLWEELENYGLLPQCPCRIRCACLALREFKNMREQDYVIHFLPGLNDDYSTIRSQILVKERLFPLNRVFSLILQYKRQNSLIPDEDSQVFVNMTKF